MSIMCDNCEIKSELKFKIAFGNLEGASTCLNSIWLWFVGSDLSPNGSPNSVAAPPQTAVAGGEVAPSQPPGIASSSVLTTSVGFLLVASLVASFSSF